MVDAINFHEQALRDKNSTPVLLVLDRSTGKIYQAGAEIDGDTAILRVMNYVWDPDNTEPAKMTQPITTLNLEGDLTVTLGDVERLLGLAAPNMYWQRGKIFYDANNNPEYLCGNTDVDANETDTDWRIWKFTYTAAGEVEEWEGPRNGAVNVTPSGLSWNI